MAEREWGLAAGAESALHLRAVFLAEEKRPKPDGIYRQEYECEFVAIAGALFDEAALRRW